MRTKQPKLGKKLLSLTIMLTTLLTLFAPPSYAASDGIEGVYPIPKSGGDTLPLPVRHALSNGTHCITEININYRMVTGIWQDKSGSTNYKIHYPLPTWFSIDLPTVHGGVSYAYNTDSNTLPKGITTTQYYNVVADYKDLQVPLTYNNTTPLTTNPKDIRTLSTGEVRFSHNVKIQNGLASGSSMAGCFTVINIDAKFLDNLSGLVYHYHQNTRNTYHSGAISDIPIYYNLVRAPQAEFLSGSYVKIEKTSNNIINTISETVQQLPTTLNNAVTNINTSLSNQILGTVQIAVNSSQRTAILSQYGLSTTITANGVYPSSQGGRYRVVFYSPPTNIDQLNLT